MNRGDSVEPANLRITSRRRREMLISKWRSLPSLYWSIIVGILAVFSVLQTTLLSGWTSKTTIGLLLGLLGLALLVAIVLAMSRKTPTEKLAMARALFSEARSRFGERDYERAESAATRSVELDPEESSTWNLLGRTLIRLGKPEEAIRAFGCALEVNRQPDWRTSYLNNRAVAHILNGDYGHARNDLNPCISETPHSWGRLRWRALASYYMGDFQAALADAEACAKEAPGLVSSQAVLGIVAKGAGKASQAAKATENALRPRLEEPEDYYYVAALKGSLGERDEALRLLAVSIQLDDKLKYRAFFDPLWECMRGDTRFVDLVALKPRR